MATDGYVSGVYCKHCGNSAPKRMTCEAKTRKTGWEFIQRTYSCGFCGKSTTREGGGPVPAAKASGGAA